MAITADRLLQGIKRRVVMPASQARLTDEDILAITDDIISSRIVPIIESVNQEFFIYRETVPLVSGQSEYSIPYRAIGRTLRELKVKNFGNEQAWNLSLIALEDASGYTEATSPAGFYFFGDKIMIVPGIAENLSDLGSLIMHYRLAPSRLVTASKAMKVAGVNGDDVIVESVPTTYMIGTPVDFIQGRSGNSIYATDQTIQNISGTTLSFSANVVPTSLIAGDYISMVESSPVVNFVPNEGYSLIESLASYRICNTIGDFDSAARLAEDISDEEKNFKSLLEPRIDGEPTVIINRSSLVRGRYPGRGGWFYGR